MSGPEEVFVLGVETYAFGGCDGCHWRTPMLTGAGAHVRAVQAAEAHVCEPLPSIEPAVPA